MGRDPKLKRYARILNPPPQYPVWSVKAISIGAALVVAISATVVSVVGHANVLREMELTLAICAAFLFVILAVGLYHGARVKRKNLPSGQYQAQGLEGMEAVDVGTVELPDAGADSVAGCLLSIVLSVAISLFAGVVVWAMVQLGGFLIVGLFFALCWVMYRALRVVFARSRQCRGRLGPSLGYAAMHTALYLGWLFVALQIGVWLTRQR